LPTDPPYDEGELIPLHIRKVDGKPATTEDYERLHRRLNAKSQSPSAE
jgi:hypothetical protein